jgi:hypothetical protein
VGGMRLNFWVSLGVWICASAFFVWWQFLRRPARSSRELRARPVDTGPRMAVPKSRVR